MDSTDRDEPPPVVKELAQLAQEAEQLQRAIAEAQDADRGRIPEKRRSKRPKPRPRMPRLANGDATSS